MSVFGPSIDIDDVESQVVATLEYWIDSYLADKERAKGWNVGRMGRPGSYNATYDYDNWPEGQLPGIAVVCNGTVDPVEYHGPVAAWFEVNVDAIVSGQTEGEVRTVAAAYQSAVTKLLTEQSALAGSGTTPFADDVRFVGWELELPDVSNRTLAVGTTQLHVLVDNLFDPRVGPLSPPGQSDPGDYPQAETTSLEIDGLTLT